MAPAAAQSGLTAARAELDAGRFAQAVRLYDEAAEASSGLDRDSLVRLLRERALARAALRDTAGARRDLTALFSLDSSPDFGAEAPPSFQRLIGNVQQDAAPLTLEADAAPVDGGYEVRSRLTDPGELVREVRVLELRDGRVETHRGEVVTIPAVGGLRYVVQAIGPGGAVLAELGSPDAPRTIGDPVIELGPGQGTPPGDDSGLLLGLSLGIGGAVVAGVVLAIVLALVLPGSSWQPSVPMEID